MDQTFTAARKRLGLDQKAMAEALGISQASLSRIERGQQEPSGRVVLALQRFAKQRRVKLTWPEAA